MMIPLPIPKIWHRFRFCYRTIVLCLVKPHSHPRSSALVGPFVSGCQRDINIMLSGPIYPIHMSLLGYYL